MSSERGGYYVEYAKSGRSSCKYCKGPIPEDSIRIGWETKAIVHDGWDMGWYHLKCCNKDEDSTPQFTSIKELKHWEFLRWKDQAAVRSKIGDTEAMAEDKAEEKRLEERNKAFWEMEDELASQLNGKQVKDLVAANGLRVEKVSANDLLHRAADGMLWGKTGPCPECRGADVYYNTVLYKCKGWISEFTRCTWTGPDIQRYRWKIPDALKAKCKWLKGFEYPPGHPAAPAPAFAAPGTAASAQPAAAPAPAAAGEAPAKGEGEGAAAPADDMDVEPAGEEEEPPVGKELYGFVVGFAGTAAQLGMARAGLAELVESHGGRVSDDEATVFVAAQAELTKARKTKKVTSAVEEGIPFLKVEWLNALCNREGEGIKLRKPEVAAKYLLEGSPELAEGKVVCRKYFRARAEKEEQQEEEDGGGADEAEPKKRKMPVRKPAPKPGTDVLRVDPEFKGASAASILVTYDPEYGHTPYHAMLNITDITSGANKFYRMQALKVGKTFTFFIHWGRTGTEVGDSRAYEKLSERGVIDRFCEKFRECTGVDWEERQWFQKLPGKYNLIELDDGNDAGADLAEVESRRQAKRQRVEAAAAGPEGALPAAAPALDLRVRAFVESIFDKDMMKSQLKAMAVDVKKMPLGKISKKQIQSAYAVLNAASEALQVQPVNPARVRDCTNRFYTLVPHDFGEKDPPLIDSADVIKQKLELLDVLCEIEVANAIMDNAAAVGAEDKTLKNYESLHASIKPLDREGELYKMLERYAVDSHDASFFRSWSFTVDDILEISREGEEQRFAPWKANPNRQLLWHGSRLTNYVGILSNGLRIAPPEAPKTGYRFGKGAYFADCVSKSASYCFATRENNHGVIILNEVAVGVPFETPNDIYMEKAQPGSDSTWALGMTVPDPKATVTIEDGIKVPCGKPVPAGRKTMCSHDEIIVYDVAQVRIRYLLRITFNHK